MAYKPFRQNRNQDIYAKYDRKRAAGNQANESRIKLFGFRSGLSYKMIPAMLYYAFALFYIGTGIYGEIKYLEFEPIDIVLLILKYIFWILIFFSPAIFLSDFKYRDSLPLFKKRETGSSLIGLILVWMFCYFMANVNIYCMSQTYKDSLAKHEEWLKEQQQQSLQETQSKEKETTTQGESITVGQSETVSYNADKNIVYVQEGVL
ncbi:MAG: hypothetical protein ACLRZ9_05325 [Eubacterium sp.]